MPTKSEEQLRKVNYRLQQEKEEMIKEMLTLRESYIKMKKRADSKQHTYVANEKKRSTAEVKLLELTQKLERT